MSVAWLPLVPVAGAIAVVALRRHRRVVGPVAVGALLATLALAVWLVSAEAGRFSWRWGSGIALGLGLEAFGRVMAILVPVIAAPVVAFASSAESEEGGPRLLAWLLAFVGAMEILVLATDFLTLLMGWELVGACSWALIGYRWWEGDRPRAASRAFLTTRFGDLGLYLAAAAAWSASGSLTFSALEGATGPYLHVVAGGVLLAAAAKSAQLPFAPWLFSAMAGPTPASALLHSATMVAAGAYAIIRLAPWLATVPWFNLTLLVVGLATTLAAGLVAALHGDIKRALAGSTSSQYGLMFLAVGAGSPAAAGAQLVTHAAFKSLLFLGAGAAIHATGTPNLDRLGLGRSLPRTGILVAVGALALAAVPPLGGAYSKELIVTASAEAAPWVLWGVLASGTLTAFYAGRLLLLSYGPARERSSARGPSRGEWVGLASLAACTLALGLVWLPGGPTLVERVTGGSVVEGAAWELVASLAGIGLAAAACTYLWRTRRLFTLGLPDRAREPLASWLGLPLAAGFLVVRPTLRLSAALARFDDRVVDAGVRAAAAVVRALSGLLSWWGERGVDGVVEGAARLTVGVAAFSRWADDRGVDGAVEAIGRATGRVGTASRRLQSGFAHHYYVVITSGLLVLLAVAVFWR